MTRLFMFPAWAAAVLGFGALLYGAASPVTASAQPLSPANTATPGLPPASAVDPLTNDPGMAAGPIENGRHLQPRGRPTTAGKDDADALLRQGSHSPAARTPAVIPRDLYGQPMDGAAEPGPVR